MDDVLRVDVAEHSVSFRLRDHHVALEPIVHVSRQPQRLRRWLLGPVHVHGIGRATPPGPAGQPVRLFDPGSVPPDGLAKADCLEVFFRYGVKLLIQELTFRIKPVAEVHGSQALQEAMGGYQQQVLQRALLRAGASRVQFVR